MIKHSYISKIHLPIIDSALLDIGGPLLTDNGTFKFSFSKGWGRFPWGHRKAIERPGESDREGFFPKVTGVGVAF